LLIEKEIKPIVFRVLNTQKYPRLTNNIIRSCTFIEELTCGYNSKITDNGVKDMIFLKRLIINNFTNNITNVGVKNLTNLTSLSLHGCKKITDEALINLTNLTNLDISFNNIITYNAVMLLTNLRELHLVGNYTINVTMLNLPHINSLSLHGNMC